MNAYSDLKDINFQTNTLPILNNYHNFELNESEFLSAEIRASRICDFSLRYKCKDCGIILCKSKESSNSGLVIYLVANRDTHSIVQEHNLISMISSTDCDKEIMSYALR